MRKNEFMGIAVTLVALAMLTTAVLQPVAAAVITTENAIELQERRIRIDHINSVLARDSVQSTMVKLGVEPAVAMNRVASLTTSELQLLQQQLDELPVGSSGVIEVVGIVAIVLIILELLNVTNIFNSF